MRADETREIERQLQVVRRRIRWVQLWRGGLLVAAFFLGGLFSSMAMDWLFAPLPALVRWTVFLVWMGAVVWSCFRGLGAFFRKLSLVRIARWLESRHPEMEERLSTALELSGQDSASPELMKSLVQAAEEDVLLVDARMEVQPGQRTRQGRWIVGAALLVLLATFIVWPQTAGRLFVRSVAPFSEVGNVGANSFDLQPGDLEVMVGGAVEVQLAYSGSGKPEIELDFIGGEHVVQPMEKREGFWHYRLEPVRETFKYRARSGRAVSDQFLANVLPQPTVLEAMVEKDFPNYTGLGNRRTVLGETVKAVVGTQVTLEGVLNTAVEAMVLTLPDGEQVEMNLELSSKGGRFFGSFDLQEGVNGEVTLMASHRLGGQLELERFKLLAMPDLAPVVTRMSPTEDEIKVRPEEELQLDYEVREDFGLGEVVLEVEAGKSGRFELQQDLPEKEGRSQIGRYSGRVRFVVADLMDQLNGAQDIHVRIRAQDKVPEELGGPGIGYSEWLIIRAHRGAQSLARQELTAQHDAARSSIEKAIRTARDAEQKMRQSWQALVEKKESEHSQKMVKEAQEKLAQAREEVSDLAEQMKEGIHAAKSPQAEQAEKELEEALAEFEKVPLLDKKEERAQGLEEALAQSREAIQTLEKLRNEIHQDKSKVDDLARLEDLAQKQGELARQAEKEVDENSTGEDLSEKWQREQMVMAQEVKKQIYQRPDAMAEVLSRQAEQARDLAKESQEVAKSQARLAEIAKKMPNEEELRSELQKAQSELGEELSRSSQGVDQNLESKKQSKEAQENARQAAKALAQKKNEQAAELSQDAAENLQEVAASSHEDGKELAESFSDRQEKLVEAMEAFKEGKLEEAGKQLEQAQALAKGQAEDVAPKESSAGDEARTSNDELRAEVAQVLESKQAFLAQEVREQVADARSEGSPLADALPEAAAQAQEATKAFEEAGEEGFSTASEETKQASEALQKVSEQAQEMAQKKGGNSDLTAEKLSELARQQENVSKAAEALAEGRLGEALTELQAMAEEEAAELVEEIQAMPQLQGSSLGQAGQEAKRGQNQAQRASEEALKGKLEPSAQQHGHAEDSFQKASQALGKAVEQLQKQAAEASERPSPQHQVPTLASEMAQGFQSAEKAARTESAAEAAQQAGEAAEALARAAQKSRQQMKGDPQTASPGKSESLPTPQPSSPGEEASESNEEQEAEADQGVPPELAKLGISVEDWAKIKTSLQKDVGGQGGIDVPEDYQGLVKDYFQTMSEQ